ncbi:hypothetical protein MNBD_NITROSPINAE04-194 [hydrothermal vent metagenome]|uniref:Outer membrane protein beta-barrel domain-containing protein n=1 Tax=hydrothermal vent metagenome TaxID=652676 RepID=A0A3B1CIQ1_9ZZZZ
MKNVYLVIVQILLFTSIASAESERVYSMEAFLGSAYSFKTPLEIEQDGEDKISLTADYDTKPFKGAPYYAVRLGTWDEDKGWEVELIHHKLYLANNPPEVNNFEITHGYNLLTLIRGWKKQWGGKEYIVRVGAGLTLVHPEITVRNKQMHGEHTVDSNGLMFNLAGYTAQASVGRRFYFSDRIFGSLEGKFTVSTADIKMEDGEVDAPNVAVHVLFGLGYDYKRPKK